MPRIRIQTGLVAKVDAEGTIKACVANIPTKNVRAAKQQLEPYKQVDRTKYKEFSKSIAAKVKAFRELQNRNKNLELLLRKQSSRTVATMFNNIIINTKEE